MTLTFDRPTYTKLLTEFSPKVIETEEEYDRALAITEKLTFNATKTPEEQAIYRLLVLLVETYEAQHYALPTAAPHEVLQHIMEASGTQQSHLVGKLGSSKVVAEIYHGQRPINKAQAQLLAEMFKVSPSLFTNIPTPAIELPNS